MARIGLGMIFAYHPWVVLRMSTYRRVREPAEAGRL
jgi:hypothetical protein